jgi:hypothetical protein
MNYPDSRFHGRLDMLFLKDILQAKAIGPINHSPAAHPSPYFPTSANLVHRRKPLTRYHVTCYFHGRYYNYVL